MKRILRLTVVFLMIAALTLPLSAAAKSNPISDARNGVVRILTIFRNQTSYATGSGVAVGEAGKPTSVFVTNHHVIEDGSEIYVLLDNDWDKSIPAFGGTADNVHAVKCEVVYTPSSSPDYAILKSSREVTERVAQPLMAAQKAYPADRIYALGYPGAADYVTAEVNASIDDISITSGTISRFVTDDESNTRCIQIDADINQGNSGGPLITEEGYVIGLNTMYYSDGKTAKISLAIEIDYVIDKLNSLISSGKLSGFSFTVIDDPDAAQEDAPAASEEKKDSPAAPAAPADPAPETDKKKDGGFNPVILIVVLVAVGAVVAVVLVNKKNADKRRTAEKRKKAASEPTVQEIGGYKPTVQVKQAPAIPVPPVFDPAPPKEPQRPPVIEPIPADPPSLDDFMPLPGNPTEPEPPARPTFYLIGKDGCFAGKRIPVSKALTVGRQGTNDLAYPSGTPGVSSNHCRIIPAAEGVYLVDLGSTYGTVLGNGTKLPPNKKYLLKPGESFCIGTVDQKFMLAGAAQKAPAAPAAAAGPAAPAACTLAGVSGIHAGRRYPISGELRIGRGSANDVSFPDGTPGISGSHCKILAANGKIYLIDLGSTYGTFLSGGIKLPPNQKQPLSKGNTFYLGNEKQMFRIE